MKEYLFGPRLYRIFRWSQSLLKRKVGGHDYEMNTLEWAGDTFINAVSSALKVSSYCSPVIAYYIYQKGLIPTTQGQYAYCFKFIMAITIGMVTAYIVRGYGRYLNSEYETFLKALIAAKKSRDNREDIQLYDFDFRSWPCDFSWNESDLKSNSNLTKTRDKINYYDITSWPSHILQYLLFHGLGRPMAYPGSVKLLQLALGPQILGGRAILMEKNGIRSKVLTEDGNEIDTMFVDKRGDENDGKGNTLVICCEGNAAFYEVGIVETSLKAGFSALGWNHPGFFGSSGIPSAESEENAIDAIVRYAVTRLGFAIEDIVMFAWSIGGFPASYATMMYPNMKGLVLDATFDNITELALNRMPGFAEGIVRSIVKNYLDLDVARNCINYPGPIRLIRRQREEIITVSPGEPATNRGNFLLLSILRHRYPNIFVKESVDVVLRFLSAIDRYDQNAIIDGIGGINKDACESRLIIHGNKVTFPLDIGLDWSNEVKIETAMFLCKVYMDHFDAPHCLNLPSKYLQLPWQHQLLPTNN